jgi:hypothetical protein
MNLSNSLNEIRDKLGLLQKNKSLLERRLLDFEQKLKE